MTEHSPAAPVAVPALDLSILIVSWNVRDLLAACLESIAAGPLALVAPDGAVPGDGGPLRVEVIVVDSASTDGTPAMIAERSPGCTCSPSARTSASHAATTWPWPGRVGVTCCC
ncbi:MAG: glycosyltransferase [Anaerolineae bacterium]|nr:glycosyltransferase [Anaerolineae bacterium]